MNVNLGNVLAGTGALILVYLLVTNAANFNTIIGTGGGFTLSAIQTLQGRQTVVPFNAPANPNSLLGSITGR